MGFLIGLFLGVALGVFLQPAVVAFIARRAHEAASKAVDADDDDYRRIVVPPAPPSPNDAPFGDVRSPAGTS